MASPGSDANRHLHLQHHHTEAATEPAVREARKWIEAVTGRSFGEKDFRGGLDNGILLCELLSCIKPCLVKKINRLPTPLAGLDNVTLFLKGCEELGLKGSQLFDPGDLQDTRTNNKASDCNKRLRNVLITIYWLGRAANSSATYNGPTLDLREFEGLLSQMRKEVEDWDSPKRSIRDSGYIDCWETERSESLSPPRHAREDSFDSLDSIGSRSRHTPSPDGLFARGSSDGRGSDSECDFPIRKLPDVRRDDMLARRTSCSELRTTMPFNQYLPNKSNQTSYVPIPLRKQRSDREESCKSWSSATSPVGGERPYRFSRRDSVFDDPESVSMIDMRGEEDGVLTPHSQIRHELIHGQYHRMKEEDSQWQDDLAKWKSRRRSVSQDLIKKEEERKMMERMLSFDEGTQRRKSIKTYREIVEEKERRERDLQDAYLRARTPEEAEAVLRRYAQRFTISDVVLERLKLPRVLERSISADPTRLTSSPTDSGFSCSSPSSSNPLQYLRQQSLPAPKFTSTVEAHVTGYDLERGIGGNVSRSSGARSGRNRPLFGPKLYGHDRTSKREAMEKLNGETDKNHNKPDWGVEREREDEGERKSEGDSSPLIFYPSPNQDVDSDSTEIPVSDALSSDKHLTCTLDPEQLERADSEIDGNQSTVRRSESRVEEDVQNEGPSSDSAFLPSPPNEEEAVPQTRGVSPPLKQEDPETEVLAESERSPEEQLDDKTDSATINHNNSVQTEQLTHTSSQSYTVPESFSQPVLESSEGSASQSDLSSLDHSRTNSAAGRPVPEPVEKQHGNEKYQREQERLKHEWELAQKEVEEEERRYHEEERKILEETVAPLTPHSPLPPSPRWQESGSLNSSGTQHTIIRSLADWERKQKEMNESLENKKQRETEMKEPTWTKEEQTPDSQQSHEQLLGQSNGQSEGAREQNQDPDQLQTSQEISWSSKHSSSESWQKTSSLDRTKNSQSAPGGRRRSGSVENADAMPSQSISFTDTEQPPSPNRSVSGKKLCSSCGLALGKGAAMIIETLKLYFHIQCFRCGICKGQLGDTTTGTDVRIRNGLLNCHQCYIRSRSAGQPTNL